VEHVEQDPLASAGNALGPRSTPAADVQQRQTDAAQRAEDHAIGKTVVDERSWRDRPEVSEVLREI
jgi:hypothetical protein